jgi:hypothetical protein
VERSVESLKVAGETRSGSRSEVTGSLAWRSQAYGGYGSLAPLIRSTSDMITQQSRRELVQMSFEKKGGGPPVIQFQRVRVSTCQSFAEM